MSSEEGEEVGKRAKEETAESEEARGKQRREGKNWEEQIRPEPLELNAKNLLSDSK